MPDRDDVAYFGAGPAPLPTSVLQRGAEAFVNFENTGLSLAEISHRSATANKILADTKAALASLLSIPDDYEILFMHGGGSAEFSAVVHNLVAVWVEKQRRKAVADLGADKDEQVIVEKVKREVRESLRLDYLVTGSWSLKASQEAANLLEPLGKGFANVAVDSRETNGGKFGTIPPEKTWTLTPRRSQGGKGSAFAYYCDNETVDGVEFPHLPNCLDQSSQDEDDEVLVVADMSSNFLSRHVDVSKYAVIFVCPVGSAFSQMLNSRRVARRRILVLPMLRLLSSVRTSSYHILPLLSCMQSVSGHPQPSLIGPSSLRTTPSTIPCPSSASG